MSLISAHGIEDVIKLEQRLNLTLAKSLNSTLRFALEPFMPSRTIAIYNVEYNDSALEEEIENCLNELAGRLGINTIKPIANTEWLDNPPRLLLEFVDYRGIRT